MKTLSELKQFYQTRLLADLSDLEHKRRKVLQKLTFVGIVILCIVAPSVFVTIILRMEPHILLGSIVLSVLIAVGAYKSISKDYIAEFKILIIDRIVRFIDENLSYYRMGCIPQSTFMLSQIFKTKPNRYKGDDLVSGKIGETEIRFSELNAEYESGSGKNRSVRTVFKGLFFIGDFNKDFTCRTVVLPDTAEKLFGRIGQKLQSMNLVRDDLIKLDDPEFEKLFVVYGNDQVGARYILSTSLMKRIVDFKNKTNRDIYLSFIGSMVFVAISYKRNLFEPRIFETLLDFDPVREYFEDLQLAVGIVDDLNLNTRIWTKR
jgi:hypothetical protein